MKQTVIKIDEILEYALAGVSQPDIGADELVALTLNVGECGVKAMALLSKEL